MPQISDSEYKKGYKIFGKDVLDEKGSVVRSDAEAPGTGVQGPVNTEQQTPPGQLPGVDGQTTGTGGIFNYQTAVRLALNEATTKRKGSQMATLAPFTAGLPNNALSQVIGSINEGANLDATGTYKSFLDSQAEERKIQQQKEENALDIVKEMASDGSLGELPDGAIIALSKNSGIDAAQLLAWRTSVKKDKELGVEKIKAEIEATKALAQQRRDGDGSGGGGNYGSTKALTVGTKNKYFNSLPNTVTQGKYNYVMDNINDLIAGTQLTENNRYDFWGTSAKWIDEQTHTQGSPLYGITSSDLNALLWEKFHPDGLAGFNKEVNNQKTASQVNNPKTTNIDRLLNSPYFGGGK